MFDCIVIGAGPAGVECSLYLKRAGLNILVLYKNYESSLSNALIENYYGFLDVDGNKLYDNGIKQLNKLNVNLKNEEVIDIDYIDSFKVKTLSNIYESKYLVIATGIKNKLPNKFVKYLGYGVSLCAHCDMPLKRGKLINLTGKDPYLSELVNDTLSYTDKYKIYDIDKIDSLYGEKTLEGIVYNGENIPLDNLFLAFPISSESLYSKLGIFLNEYNKIDTDKNYKTNIKNLYAIGDIGNINNQVALSVYSGYICALDIIKDIKK